MLNLNLLEIDIENCREFVEKGEECPTVLESLIKLRDRLNNATDSEWKIYNDLFEHLRSDNDPVNIIVNGLLAIEKIIHRFINLRNQQPSSHDNNNSVTQCVDIAEKMCLNREEPKWLWNQVRELNSIRNKLVAQSIVDPKNETVC